MSLLDEIKAELHKLFGHADPVVQTVAKDAAAKLDELKTEVETDAKTIAADAEHAAAPVASEAGADVKKLASEAGADIGDVAKEA